jgi:hypothetical protein
MRRSTRRFLFAASLVLGVSVSARADMVTVTAAIPAQTTDFSLPVPPVTAFNHALGTLTEVQLTLSTSGTFAGTGTNNSSGTANFSVSESVNLSLTGHSITPLTPSLTETKSYTAVPVGGTVAFGPFAPTATSATDVFTSGALFDLFNGGGSVGGFTLSTLTETVVSGAGGNAKVSLTTTVGGGILAVTYIYTPTVVPEPASIALIGLGGAFVLTGSRFRRKAVNRDAV